MKKILLFLTLIFTTSYVEAISGFDAVLEDVVTRTLPEVTVERRLKPIELRTLNIDTKITANIAQTTYEMVFYNPNKRILEGELKLPLLEGQSLVEYALEVDGHYRLSSVVEKAKAKQAFENTIRQNIDPGLIEKTLGNNYRLRLYPLPSRGVKKVKVTVEEILLSKEQNYRYTIPFISNKKIKNFSLHIAIASNKPRTKLYGLVKDSVFNSMEQGAYFSYKKTNMRLRKPIVLALKKSEDTKVFFQKNSKGKKNWFMAVLPKQKQLKRRGFDNTHVTKHIEIIWDTSLSSERRDIAKELAFLEKFFRHNSKTTYIVKLSTLDIAMHHHGTFKVQGKKWKKLKAKLQSFHYHGAKDLSKMYVSKKVKQVLFFSNGVNSFSDSVHVKKGVPIISVNSAVGADSNTMRYIANVSHGKYLNLLQLSVKGAIDKLYQNDACRIKHSSSNISETYVKDVGDSVVILGRIRGKRGSIQYTLGTLDYHLDIKKPMQSSLLSRVWASSKINHLSLRYKKNRKKIIALAKWYKIVTKNTSLIVLDRVEDYLRYEILPPKSLQKRYYALRKQQQKEKRGERKRAIEESISLLKEQKRWYRTKFPLPKKKSNYEEISENGGDIAPVEPVMEASMATPTQARVAKKRTKSKKHSSHNPMTIKLKEWNSNASYIKALKGVAKRKLLRHYFKAQKKHKNEASFYVDMSDYFYKKGLKKESLLILSNLLELDFEKSEFIRVFAFKLLEHKWYSKSIFFFKKVKELRPFELQSTRDLALAYERVRKYQEALKLHYEIITKVWGSRFNGAKIVSINELNHLISKHKLNLSKIDRRLIASMPVDVRIVINWSTDNTDMDLWVIDPKGEKTFYGNRTSRIGGKISNDMTRGYGPEEFLIKKAIRGKYIIKVKYYASSQQKLTGPTVIRTEVYTKYGKKHEKREEIVFRIEEEKEIIDLGEIVY